LGWLQLASRIPSTHDRAVIDQPHFGRGDYNKKASSKLQNPLIATRNKRADHPRFRKVFSDVYHTAAVQNTVQTLKKQVWDDSDSLSKSAVFSSDESLPFLAA
jgi:hypothetical protein